MFLRSCIKDWQLVQAEVVCPRPHRQKHQLVEALGLSFVEVTRLHQILAPFNSFLFDTQSTFKIALENVNLIQ